MARRLSVKHRKTKRNVASARKNGIQKVRHKVAVERSTKHRFKNQSRMV